MTMASPAVDVRETAEVRDAAVIIPITSPWASATAPPESPGAIGAFIWMRPPRRSGELPGSPAVIVWSRALIDPMVAEACLPRGRRTPVAARVDRAPAGTGVHEGGLRRRASLRVGQPDPDPDTRRDQDGRRDHRGDDRRAPPPARVTGRRCPGPPQGGAAGSRGGASHPHPGRSLSDPPAVVPGGGGGGGGQWCCARTPPGCSAGGSTSGRSGS